MPLSTAICQGLLMGCLFIQITLTSHPLALSTIRTYIQRASNYSKVTRAPGFLISPAIWLIFQQLVQATIKWNIKAPHYWPMIAAFMHAPKTYKVTGIKLREVMVVILSWCMIVLMCMHILCTCCFIYAHWYFFLKSWINVFFVMWSCGIYRVSFACYNYVHLVVAVTV